MELTIEAKDQAEAKRKALEKFEVETGRELDEGDLELELIGEESELLGFNKTETYRVTLTIEEDIKEEAKEDQEIVESKDGEVKLIINEEGVFIEVSPAQGSGKKVDLNQMEKTLEAKEIEEVDYGQLSEILVEDTYDEPVQVAPRKPDLDRDADIKIKINNDQMKAYLTIKRALGGKEATIEDVKAELEAKGVKFGIKEQKLKELSNQDNILEDIEDLLIAEGTAPLPGQDAEINLKFDPAGKDKQVKQLEDGSVDYHNLGKINNVREGDLLATKKSIETGTPGTTVTGEDIKPEAPIDKKIPNGKNTKLSDDGLSLYADIEGQVVLEGDKISALPIHTINGDVDLSTGNIKFLGTVEVGGDVRDGMKVEAKQDIQIKGSVHGGRLEAGGTILIQNGFIGRGKGELQAKEDIKVKFIENGRVVTDRDLIVKDAIMHSDIDAARIIRVENKGLIVGGIVRAGREIDAKVIGSNLATKTLIFVGITPELRDEYNELMEGLESYQQELDETLKTISYLKKRQEQDKLAEKERNLLSQKTRVRFQVTKHIEELKGEKESIEKRLGEGKDGKIKIQNKLYPGVQLTIGTEVKKTSKELSNITYYIEEGEVKKGSYV